MITILLMFGPPVLIELVTLTVLATKRGRRLLFPSTTEVYSPIPVQPDGYTPDANGRC